MSFLNSSTLIERRTRRRSVFSLYFFSVAILFLGPMKVPVVPGHIPSEQAAMVECARRLKTFAGEVSVGSYRPRNHRGPPETTRGPASNAPSPDVRRPTPEAQVGTSALTGG